MLLLIFLVIILFLSLYAGTCKKKTIESMGTEHPQGELDVSETKSDQPDFNDILTNLEEDIGSGNPLDPDEGWFGGNFWLAHNILEKHNSFYIDENDLKWNANVEEDGVSNNIARFLNNW